MNDPLSKLRSSNTQPRPGVNRPQGNRNKANGPVRTGRQPKKRSILLPALLIAVGCAVLLFAAWSAVNSPVLASIMNFSSPPQQAQQTDSIFYSHADIAKPTYTPAAEMAVVQQQASPTATLTAMPEFVATDPPVEVAPLDVVIVPEPGTDEPQVQASVPETSNNSYTISAAIVPDTPTPEYVAEPTAETNTQTTSYVPPTDVTASGEHWIDVDLSQQRLYAYAGDTVVNSFVVSTGTWQTPTVTGKYKIWIKLKSAAMSGPGYYLPDVPYIMYFYKGYGLHGTYWHNNFGTPMSHGCVNLTIPDAEWVYNFTQVGTVVNVHY